MVTQRTGGWVGGWGTVFLYMPTSAGTRKKYAQIASMPRSLKRMKFMRGGMVSFSTVNPRYLQVCFSRIRLLKGDKSNKIIILAMHENDWGAKIYERVHNWILYFYYVISSITVTLVTLTTRRWLGEWGCLGTQWLERISAATPWWPGAVGRGEEWQLRI